MKSRWFSNISVRNSPTQQITLGFFKAKKNGSYRKSPFSFQKNPQSRVLQSLRAIVLQFTDKEFQKICIETFFSKNGVGMDADSLVYFGRRIYDSSGMDFVIHCFFCI